MLELYTIGVYDFGEEAFFAALQAHDVDLFCDVRQRRGLRGRRYAFANSRRLQARLAELGIAYLHRKDLAPAPELRRIQQRTDRSAGTKKRERPRLSPAFGTAYQDTVLTDFDAEAFVAGLDPEVTKVAFFCVEREPQACHRSLLADHMARVLGLSVTHILP
ncbi:MAG: DUF488 domain-containing protein [Candidatus Promineifilaceae bacterium]|nr:DUF488 domain-containing protein [Candidatus Promineifilaceae bacterium]